MKRFLAILRRLFLGGTISLLVVMIAFGKKFPELFDLAKAHEGVPGYFSIFILGSPILFLLFTVFSVIYIRHSGQFAAYQQQKAWMATFFQCLGSDLSSPFKNIRNFFCALFSKNAMGRGVLIVRFIELVVLVVGCVFGVRSLI